MPRTLHAQKKMHGRDGGGGSPFVGHNSHAPFPARAVSQYGQGMDEGRLALVSSSLKLGRGSLRVPVPFFAAERRTNSRLLEHLNGQFSNAPEGHVVRLSSVAASMPNHDRKGRGRVPNQRGAFHQSRGDLLHVADC